MLVVFGRKSHLQNVVVVVVVDFRRKKVFEKDFLDDDDDDGNDDDERRRGSLSVVVVVTISRGGRCRCSSRERARAYGVRERECIRVQNAALFFLKAHFFI